MAENQLTPNADASKACSKCGTVKPLAEFYKDKRRAGVGAECKSCAIARMRSKLQTPEGKAKRVAYIARYKEANKDRLRSYFQRRRLDPTIRERTKAYFSVKNFEPKAVAARRAYDASARAKGKAKARRATEEFKELWKQRNRTAEARAKRRKYYSRPEVKERLRKWYRSDKGRAKNQRRLARKMGLPIDFVGADITFARGYWKGHCAACGCDLSGIKWCLDHWIPLTASDCPGTVPGNMVPLCGHCNSTKCAKRAERWVREEFEVEADGILSRVAEFFKRVRQTDGRNQNHANANED